MQFNIPEDQESIIKVIGVGGGGSNAVTHMFKQGIVGVDFAICNTDNQAMGQSEVPIKIQLGPSLTEGRGAGSRPNIGRESCMESIEDVRKFFDEDTKMLFITAGMGGGTGTGAAPVIAQAAQEMDILTVAIVTTPFTFEGRRRSSQAHEGLEELKKHVDTLIVISNDKLRQIHGNLSLGDAFSQADNILTTAAKGIAEIITVPGYVNVDFEDVNTVMRGSGVAVMGTAMMEGEDRAIRAVEAALQSPLLEENEIRGAQHILLNITSGSKEVTMDEVFEITEFVQEEAGYGTDLIWGNCHDESLGEKIAVTVIATGFEGGRQKREELERRKERKRPEPRVRVSLDADEDKGKKEPKRPRKLIDLEEDDNEITFDFDVSKFPKKKVTNSGAEEEPYIKEETEVREEEARLSETLEERRRRLKKMSLELNDPQIINELENQPAYLRRNVKLDQVRHSSEGELSKWTISDEEEPRLNDDNSYLHDNVD